MRVACAQSFDIEVPPLRIVHDRFGDVVVPIIPATDDVRAAAMDDERSRGVP